jgi:hypothetical protein
MRRALDQGDLLNARVAASEIPVVAPSEALELVLLVLRSASSAEGRAARAVSTVQVSLNSDAAALGST